MQVQVQVQYKLFIAGVEMDVRPRVGTPPRLYLAGLHYTVNTHAGNIRIVTTCTDSHLTGGASGPTKHFYSSIKSI